jgi:hypothetical protein
LRRLICWLELRAGSGIRSWRRLPVRNEIRIAGLTRPRRQSRGFAPGPVWPIVGYVSGKRAALTERQGETEHDGGGYMPLSYHADRRPRP